jgi:hypothetical protein
MFFWVLVVFGVFVVTALIHDILLLEQYRTEIYPDNFVPTSNKTSSLFRSSTHSEALVMYVASSSFLPHVYTVQQHCPNVPLFVYAPFAAPEDIHRADVVWEEWFRMHHYVTSVWDIINHVPAKRVVFVGTQCTLLQNPFHSLPKEQHVFWEESFRHHHSHHRHVTQWHTQCFQVDKSVYPTLEKHIQFIQTHLVPGVITDNQMAALLFQHRPEANVGTPGLSTDDRWIFCAPDHSPIAHVGPVQVDTSLQGLETCLKEFQSRSFPLQYVVDLPKEPHAHWYEDHDHQTACTHPVIRKTLHRKDVPNPLLDVEKPPKTRRSDWVPV